MVYAFAAALSWACTNILLRRLATRMDSFLANGLRAALALVVVLPLALFTQGLEGFRSLTPGVIALLLGGVLLGGVVGDGLYMMSLRHVGVGRALPVASTSPLFAFLFSILLLGTQPRWEMALGLVLVIGGVYLVARPRTHVGGADEFVDRAALLRGLAMAGIAAVMWGLNTVLLSIGLQHVHSTVANSLRMPLVATMSLVVAGARGRLRGIGQIDRKSWVLLLLTGIWGAGLGSTLYVAGVAAIGPTSMATISTTAPLFAVPLSAIFLHERPTRYTLIGTLLTVVGVVLVL